MQRTGKLALVFTLVFVTLNAKASSCDPSQPIGVDNQIVNYNESNCAKNALKIAADRVQEGEKAQSSGEFQHMCSAVYSALLQLENTRQVRGARATRT